MKCLQHASVVLNESMCTELKSCAILKWLFGTLCAAMHPYDLPILIHTFHAHHTHIYTLSIEQLLVSLSFSHVVRLLLPFPCSFFCIFPFDIGYCIAFVHKFWVRKKNQKKKKKKKKLVTAATNMCEVDFCTENSNVIMPLLECMY